jgi:hypothetical protein
MHLKVHPEAVTFLREFAIAFFLVLFGAMSVMRYRRWWRGSRWNDRESKGE